jgi:hypothetical protein
MRKVIISALAAATLAAAPLSLAATPAFADPDFSQVCNQHDDFGFSHGACVSIINSNLHSSAVFHSLCRQLQQQYPVEFNALFRNIGDCVSSLNGLLPPTPSPSPSPTPTT